MTPLKIFAAALSLVVASPAHAQGVGHWRAYIDEAALRFGVPVEWIERVIRAESGGHPELDGRPIISRAGAMGLMQLMPGTWADMRAMLGLGRNPHDPRDNILAGTRYLRIMYDRFGYPGLFAAYNAGPARYAALVAERRPLPGETRAYLVSVTGERPLQSGPVQAAPTNAIFFVLRPVPSVARNSRTGSASLFLPIGRAEVLLAESPP